MRSLALIALCLSLLTCVTFAEEFEFDGGRLDATWEPDRQILWVEITLGIVPADSHMWVLTVAAHRFGDGVFAWQMHYSESMDSVLILPNDFLTARNFTTEQLGIEAMFEPKEGRLTLGVPSGDVIPRLIAPGDQLEIHALWVQQEPLVAFAVPVYGPNSTLPAGGGANSDEGTASISMAPLPLDDHYAQGEPITHRFRLPQDVRSEDGARVVLSYTLMRIHDDRAAEFARFAHIAYSVDEDTYFYQIDTTTLPVGPYRLMIDSANSVYSDRMDLVIEPPERTSSAP
jgi:hypothetical protein